MADIREILKKMTMREKIGQLMQYNANIFIDTDAAVTGEMVQLGISEDELMNLGSVLNFKTSAEVREIQKKNLALSENKIPMVFMMDVIHGFRTIFPIPLALGCSFDTKEVKECTRLAAEEAAKGGVHVTFTPMVDYVRDARWGRVMETCGEDAYLNSIMGAAQVEAFQGEDLKKEGNIACCVKHFAGYGGAEAGREYNTVELSENVLREYYLPAYKACIDAGARMLMPSFNTLNGVPSVANKWLMKTILKDEWGFDGVVISDYAAVNELIAHGVCENQKEAAQKAFECGCDIEMCTTAYFNYLEELVNEGVFTTEELDEAVLRVLKLKDDLGLFENPYKGIGEKDAEPTEESREIVRRAAEKCAVLLKNDGVLPFDMKTKRIALIGPMADEKGIIGFWSCNGRDEESVSVKEGVERLLPEAEIRCVKGCSNTWNDYDTSLFDEAIAAAEWADAVILCLGEKQGYSGEGNCRTDLTLPGMQEELAEAICSVNKNTAVVTFSGRPIVLTRVAKAAGCILHMWFPGTEGGNAAANLLFGKANPSGKLSMTFPKATGQVPIYYNHKNTSRPKPVDRDEEHIAYNSNYIDCGNLPLYSFGHGLSYSHFVYEDLTLSADKMTRDEKIKVKITVLNDSDIDGEEVVMLYMRDVVASTSRPVQQLIDFEKIEIKAHDKAEVEFEITEEKLRFWNFENKLVSESGRFEISTGYADHLLHTKSFVLVD